MPRQEFRSRLRELCERAGVSLGWLAQESGLTLDALQKIASGRRQPLVTTALRIAEALGVEVEDLVVATGKTRKSSRFATQSALSPATAPYRRRR